MFPFKKDRTHFLSQDEIEQVLSCVKRKENETSGEIRLCIESRCPYMDPLYRAQEIFKDLIMFNTENRNGVLIYIAYEDRDFALYADKALHEKMPKDFWQQECKTLARNFYHGQRFEGIVHCVESIGTEMSKFFPASAHQKNELPDEIIFGR